MTPTTWFPGSIKPVYPGVYQRDFHGLIVFSWFDGKSWSTHAFQPIYARVLSGLVSAFQDLPWRGVER